MDKLQKAILGFGAMAALIFVIIICDNHGYISNEIIFYRPLYLFDLAMFWVIMGVVSPFIYFILILQLDQKDHKFMLLPDWAKEEYIQDIFPKRKLSLIFIVIGVFFGVLSYQMTPSVMVEDLDKLISDAEFSIEINSNRNEPSYRKDAILLTSLEAQRELLILVTKKNNVPIGMLAFALMSTFSLCAGLFFRREAKNYEKLINESLIKRET